jgi:hypothetical protein
MPPAASVFGPMPEFWLPVEVTVAVPKSLWRYSTLG